MELELGLALPNARPAPAAGELAVLLGRKRRVGEAFGASKVTLPLFVRGDEGDDCGEGEVVDRQTSSKRAKRLVGWPPVKCAHRRLGCGGGYVKVRMEGVAIGRKVDVSLHGSYDELLRTLDRMFPPLPSASQGGGADYAEEDVAGRHDPRRHPYAVTYEDGDGDWLLVGDVPWEAFATSVKRLKILA